MVFWIIIGGLAIGVAAVLGLTLVKGRVGDAPPAAYDLQVYRDQLKEVERDLARGVIGAEDAERIRAEVSRRVLAADAQLREGGETGGQPRGAGLALAGFLVVLVGGGALALYDRLGAPGYQDLPLKARIAASDEARATRMEQAEAEARAQLPETGPNPQATPEFLALMEKLRETVAARPNDVQGLQLLVRNEAALGNLPAAYEAQARLIEAKGLEATARDFAIMADMMISATGGFVSADAEAALRASLQRDPREPTARYYMGLYMLQVDRPDVTFRTWETLLNESRPDAPWVPPIRAQLEDVARLAGVEYSLPRHQQDAPKGPSAADVEAASEMSEADRQDMIRSMVTRLSDRLSAEGGSAQDWARLIGAYGVLGETGLAEQTFEDAKTTFWDKPEALEMLQQAARTAGIAE